MRKKVEQSKQNEDDEGAAPRGELRGAAAANPAVSVENCQSSLLGVIRDKLWVPSSLQSAKHMQQATAVRTLDIKLLLLLDEASHR